MIGAGAKSLIDKPVQALLLGRRHRNLIGGKDGAAPAQKKIGGAEEENRERG